MPGEMSRGRLVQRLITFYAILAVIAVAVVIFVVDKGGSEKAQPAIAGGYTASTASPCIGPVPKPVGGTPLPATAPAQAAATGTVVQRAPVRAVRQLHEQPGHARREASAERDRHSQAKRTASPETSDASTASR